MILPIKVITIKGPGILAEVKKISLLSYLRQRLTYMFATMRYPKLRTKPTAADKPKILTASVFKGI